MRKSKKNRTKQVNLISLVDLIIGKKSTEHVYNVYFAKFDVAHSPARWQQRRVHENK